MAMIKVNMDGETPWGTANKIAARLGQQQGETEAATRRMMQGDLEGNYDDDEAQKLRFLAAQGKQNLEYLGAQNQFTRERDQFMLDNSGSGMPGSRRYGAGSSSVTGLNPNAAAFADGLAEGGVTNPNAIAAYLGHASVETGGTFNPRTSHDNGTGFGMLGWRDPSPGSGRWTGLKQFASEKGLDPADPKTQGLWAAREAQTSESQYLGQPFLNAKTPDEAAQMLLRSQRPDPNLANMPRRLADTNRFAALLQGQKPGQLAKGPSVAQQKFDLQQQQANLPDPIGNHRNENGWYVDKDGREYEYHGVSLSELNQIKAGGNQIGGIDPTTVVPEPRLKSRDGKMMARFYVTPPAAPTGVATQPAPTQVAVANTPPPTATPAVPAQAQPVVVEPPLNEEHNSFGG